MYYEKAMSYMEATGVIAYNMTNNYMFRFILQQNKKVLKGLICALLHLKPERSLNYLCRSFDHLYSGQKYEEALPVIHIGFLDYTLFPDYPEFYATYKLMNVKNFNTYSSKFVLSVVDLTKVELATEEDRAFRIDYRAKIFKAKTWEDLKMLVKDNEYLEEAANSLYVANADEIVRQQCRAREDAERRERTLERDKQIWMKKYEESQSNNAIQNFFRICHAISSKLSSREIPTKSCHKLHSIFTSL